MKETVRPGARERKWKRIQNNHKLIAYLGNRTDPTIFDQ